jgi:hypothetical protein
MTSEPENKITDKKKQPKRAIVIAAFGDRATQVERLVHNIRRFVDYPIHIITTEDSNIGDAYFFGGIHREYVTRLWPAHQPRSGVRNSNYYKVKWVVTESFKLQDYSSIQFDSILLLDDDMLIIDKNFVDGFDMAERFGAALPLNPRIYTWANAFGADVLKKDLDDLWRIGVPSHSPAVNFAPFFVSPKHNRARNFLITLQSELRDNTCRGTLAVTKASWQTGFTPLYLPQQWCVCGGEAEYIKQYTQQLRGQQMPIPPIMLHLGHEETQRVFKDEIAKFS